MLISTAKYAHLDNEPLLQVHDEVKRVLIVAVTSDRGLAGGFNTNVLRYVEKLSKEKQREGAEVEVAACGKKAIGYFTYRASSRCSPSRDIRPTPSSLRRPSCPAM